MPTPSFGFLNTCGAEHPNEPITGAAAPEKHPLHLIKCEYCFKFRFVKEVRDIKGHAACDKCWDDYHDIQPVEKPKMTEAEAKSEDADVVYQPAHYASMPVEPITFGMLNNVSPTVFNVVKYVARAGKKLYPGKNSKESEIIDLQKAIRYCEMRISMLENEEHFNELIEKFNGLIL